MNKKTEVQKGEVTRLAAIYNCNLLGVIEVDPRFKRRSSDSCSQPLGHTDRICSEENMKEKNCPCHLPLRAGSPGASILSYHSSWHTHFSPLLTHIRQPNFTAGHCSPCHEWASNETHTGTLQENPPTSSLEQRFPQNPDLPSFAAFITLYCKFLLVKCYSSL